MPGDPITSTANPFFRRVRALAAGRRDRSEHAFYCEGVQPVWRALRSGAEIETLVVSLEVAGDTSPAARLVEEARSAGIGVVEVSGGLFRRLSDRDGPTGVAAIVHRSERSLEELPVQPGSVFVVLHEIANPGNLGSILRTADAGGAEAVILSGVTADPFAPASVKASMGSLFNVTIGRAVDADRLFTWTARCQIATVTTSEHAELPYQDLDYPRPMALVFGSEGEGLGPDLLARGVTSVRIPMVGTASSLNLSVAVGVVLFEVQRGRLGGDPGGRRG